jgi:hypothetical protein
LKGCGDESYNEDRENEALLIVESCYNGSKNLIGNVSQSIQESISEWSNDKFFCNDKRKMQIYDEYNSRVAKNKQIIIPPSGIFSLTSCDLIRTIIYREKLLNHIQPDSVLVSIREARIFLTQIGVKLQCYKPEVRAELSCAALTLLGAFYLSQGKNIEKISEITKLSKLSGNPKIATILAKWNEKSRALLGIPKTPDSPEYKLVLRNRNMEAITNTYDLRHGKISINTTLIKKDELNLPIDKEIKNLKSKINTLVNKNGGNKAESEKFSQLLLALESFRDTALSRVAETSVKLIHSSERQIQNFDVNKNLDPSQWNWGPHSGKGVYTYPENGFEPQYARNTHGDVKHKFTINKGTTVLDLSNSNFPEVREYISEAYSKEMDQFVKGYAGKQTSKKFQDNWNLVTSSDKNDRINEVAKNIFIIEKAKELTGSPELIIQYGIFRNPEVIINSETILKKFELTEF